MTKRKRRGEDEGAFPCTRLKAMDEGRKDEGISFKERKRGGERRAV